MNEWTRTDIDALLGYSSRIADGVETLAPFASDLATLLIWFFAFWLIHLGYRLASNFTPSAREIVDR